MFVKRLMMNINLKQFLFQSFNQREWSYMKSKWEWESFILEWMLVRIYVFCFVESEIWRYKKMPV